MCSTSHDGCLEAAAGVWECATVCPLCIGDDFCLLCRYTQRCPPLQILHGYLPLHQQLPRLQALQPARLQALLLHRLLPLSLPLSLAPQQPQKQMTAPQRQL